MVLIWTYGSPLSPCDILLEKEILNFKEIYGVLLASLTQQQQHEISQVVVWVVCCVCNVTHLFKVESLCLVDP